MGVDFSGAGEDDRVGNTWITRGELVQREFTIEQSEPVSRNYLEANLGAVEVAGLDFPFGVPSEIVAALGLDLEIATMPDVWQVVAQIELNMFEELLPRNARGNALQVRRLGDQHYPVAMSPLNIRMIPMTFRGMQLLHRLWTLEDANFRVPPLEPNERNGTVLLEVMPGAALQAFGFDPRNYKNNKGPNCMVNLANRQNILRELAQTSEIGLPNLADYRDRYIFNDDALDSLAAAVVACKWQLGDVFQVPENDAELAAAILEGWLYAPIVPE